MGLNNSEANSVEMQLMQVNQTSSTSSNGTVQAKAEVAMVHTLNNFLNDMINNISITPLQDFQLLKAPCNEPACSIYSNKITTATAEAAASCKSRSVFACHKLIRMYDNLIVYRFYPKKSLLYTEFIFTLYANCQADRHSLFTYMYSSMSIYIMLFPIRMCFYACSFG